MHSLMEKYYEVHHKLTQLKTQVEDYEKQIQQINGRREDEIPSRIANLKSQLEKIDDYELRIDGFMKLAEKHMTSKNVSTIEAPPGYRVNINRLKSWSLMIDPSSEDDPYAQRVYLVSKCDLCFLAQKKEEFTKRIHELEKDFENGSVEEIKEVEEKIRIAKAKIDEYLLSDELIQFAQALVSENESYKYTNAPIEYIQPQETPKYWIPGVFSLPFEIEGDIKKNVKSLFGDYYDEKLNCLYFLMDTISADTEFVMTVSCVPARKYLNEMDAGIRNLMFQIVDKSPIGTRKVYVIDALRQNSALVGSLKSLEGTCILHTVPRNTEQIQSTLEELLSSFNDIDEILENYDSVVEYNAAVSKEKQIPRSMVVIIGWPEAFEGICKDYIKRIVTNYERYGISLVMAKISSKYEEREGFGLSEYVGENIVHISMKTKEITVSIGLEETHNFLWYTFKHRIPEEYVGSIKKHTIKSDSLGTEYTKRFDMDEIPQYERGKKKLDIPYGVDTKDQIHSLSFENENFAAYLMGASGSGKSTLLHTIITGIIRNYHPDDVELWLADFKMSEFAQYIDPLPPHVKYILLDESRELIYDLIDKLTEKMMERQRFFMQHKDMKKVENVPSSFYMPVIFVILDEFSIMSQAVSESEAYKLKLQNLLAKGRALGIKFIFSSQTFIRGIAGLTQTAKDQIQTRIAMKNSYDEINNTLELTANVRTDQVKNWMDALPPHYVLSKYRDGEQMRIKRLQVMYFPGSGEEALEPQRKMIRCLNSKLKSVSSERYSMELNSYVDKHPVIVDGNSYKSYDESVLQQEEKAEYVSEEINLSLGEPRRMARMNYISLSNESRENMLVIARNAEMQCCMSLILSTVKQCKEQHVNVHVWAYNRNRLYKNYKNSHFQDMDVCEGIDEICRSIKLLKADMENKIVGRDFYILLGMEQICSDFELIDFSTSKKNNDVETVSKKYEASTEEQKQELVQMHDVYGELEQAIDEMMMDWLSQGKSMEEIDAEMNRMVDEYEKRKKIDKDKPAVVVAAPAAETEEISLVQQEEKSTAYNALKDFVYVVAQGSRLGYHFMLCINNFNDMAGTKLKTTLFNHKLAFQISADDSVACFGNKIATNLPEHICQYSNSLEQFSFRPYLHKGIEWDGWTLDDDGNVINPGMI